MKNKIIITTIIFVLLSLIISSCSGYRKGTIIRINNEHMMSYMIIQDNETKEYYRFEDPYIMESNLFSLNEHVYFYQYVSFGYITHETYALKKIEDKK